jgi:hypothetical protein
MTISWPVLSREDIIAFQFSSWFPTFSSLSIKSTIIPLTDNFKSYLEADGVFVPTGSENLCVYRFASDIDNWLPHWTITLDRRRVPWRMMTTVTAMTEPLPASQRGTHSRNSTRRSERPSTSMAAPYSPSLTSPHQRCVKIDKKDK